MKSIKKRQIILTTYLIINVLYLLVGIIMQYNSIITYKKFSYGLIVFLIFNIITILFLTIKKQFKIKSQDLIMIALIIFGIISTIFAYNPKYALFGFRGRYEGLLQITYYITLMFISTFIEKKYKKPIIYTILLTGFINVCCALNQLMDILALLLYKNIDFQTIKGFITNSNFYGSYILMCLGYTVGLYIETESKKPKIILYLLMIVFIIGLLISNTLSCTIGFIAILIYIIIYCIKTKKIKKLIIILLTSIVTFFILAKQDMTYIGNSLMQTKNEVIEMTNGNTSDSFGTNRIHIWKNMIKRIPENTLHGIGIDNLYYLFDGKPLTIYNGKVYYDKAHNEYLHTLLTQGVFAAISYVTLYLYAVMKGINKTFKCKEIYLILPIGGYLVQAFFNISVIEVAPIFYIGLGFLLERNEKTTSK